MFDRNRLHVLQSALQKSIRWCEVNESRYFAKEFMNIGCPGGVFNRLMIIAAEDVGIWFCSKRLKKSDWDRLIILLNRFTFVTKIIQ